MRTNLEWWKVEIDYIFGYVPSWWANFKIKKPEAGSEPIPTWIFHIFFIWNSAITHHLSGQILWCSMFRPVWRIHFRGFESGKYVFLFDLPSGIWLVKLFKIVFRRCAKHARVTVNKKSSSRTSTIGFTRLVRRITAESTLGWGMNTVFGTIITVSASV